MRAAIQEEIDDAESLEERPDAIVLGYGLCGNGLAGLEARTIPLVLPKAHDCITLLMGSRRRFAEYFREHPGVYYRSVGWVERGADLLPLVRESTGYGFTIDALIDRYGEDNGRYLYEELTRYRQSYTGLTFIESGLEPDRRFEDRARAEAADRGWTFEKLPGDLSLFRRLLAGDWDEHDFLIIRPGRRIVASHDERIVSIEEVSP